MCSTRRFVLVTARACVRPSYRIDPAPAKPSELVAELPLVASGIAAAPPSGTKAATPLDLRVLELAEDDAQAKVHARRSQCLDQLARELIAREASAQALALGFACCLIECASVGLV
jgi:hypothetical protein